MHQVRSSAFAAVGVSTLVGQQLMDGCRSKSSGKFIAKQHLLLFYSRTP